MFSRAFAARLMRASQNDDSLSNHTDLCLWVDEVDHSQWGAAECVGLTWAAHLFVLLSRVSLIEIAQPKIIINTKRAGRTKKYCVENQNSPRLVSELGAPCLFPAAQKVYLFHSTQRALSRQMSSNSTPFVYEWDCC
jgi:hypothetical protein